MKKFFIATLAVLGVMLGTSTLYAAANASTTYLYAPSEKGGDNQ